MFGFKKKDKKQDVVKSVVGVEILPYKSAEDVNLSEYAKISLTDALKAGSGIKSIFEDLKTLVCESGEGLYRVVLPEGTRLAKLKGENSFIGAAIKDGAGVVGQARLRPVGKATALCAAVALLEINDKLEATIETNRKILDFIEDKEKAKIEGDLDVLIEIFNDYKYNLGNETYRINKYAQAIDIKKEAAQSIKLYRTRIEKAIVDQSAYLDERKVVDKIKEVERLYGTYRVALYVYSFAYFVEVVLFENFETAYLENVLRSISRYCEDYEELYHKFFGTVEDGFETTVGAVGVKTVSGLLKGAGKFFSRLPLLGKTKFGDNLTVAGDGLQRDCDERANRAMGEVFKGDTDFTSPFTDNIRVMRSIYNGSAEVLADGENLYIKSIGEII